MDDRPREGRLTELIASIYTDTLPDVEQAALHFKQALEICRETDNRYEEAWTLWGMGRLALLVDDYTGALERYEEARKISENIGSTLQIGWDLYHMGDAWYNLGDFDQAQNYYQEAQTIFNGAHHIRGRINALISMGLVLTAQGQMDAAQQQLERACKLAEERNDLILMLRSYQALSALQRLSGDKPQQINAVRLSNRIIKLADDGGHFEHKLLGYYLRGRRFFELNDLQQAQESLVAAVEQLRELTHLHSPQISVAEIYYHYSRVLRALGQDDPANHNIYKKPGPKRCARPILIVDDQLYNAF